MKKEEAYSISIRVQADDQKIVEVIRKRWEPIMGPLTIPMIFRMGLRSLEAKK